MEIKEPKSKAHLFKLDFGFQVVMKGRSPLERLTLQHILQFFRGLPQFYTEKSLFYQMFPELLL